MVAKFPPEVLSVDDEKHDPVDREKDITGFGRQIRKGKFGFSDPAGEYPRPDYQFQPSLNMAAIGKAKHFLDIGGGDPSIDISELNKDLPPSSPSQYGDVDVMETKSGHVMVFDDTSNSERVLVKHNNGTGFEMREDGSFVLRTTHNLIQSVGGTGALIIEGDLKVSCKNLDIDASGDMNVRVGGDYNLEVGGEKKELIDGSAREIVEGNKGVIVKQNLSTMVLDQVTETFLQNHNHTVKGNFESAVRGQHSTSSRGKMKSSSQIEISQSSASINIAAADLAVFGYSGTIGGKEMVMYADNVHATDRVTSTSMHAVSFVGDLNGTALRSNQTSSQNYGEAETSGSAFSYQNTQGALKNTQQPTKEILKEYLNFSDRNVKKVDIDPGNSLRTQVDITQETGGKSKRKLNVKEARNKLKDENNAADINFTSHLASSGTVSSTFNNAVPPGIGRSSSGSGTFDYLPRDTITNGIGQGGNKMVSGGRVLKPYLPDSQYDPMKVAGGASAGSSVVKVGNTSYEVGDDLIKQGNSYAIFSGDTAKQYAAANGLIVPPIEVIKALYAKATKLIMPARNNNPTDTNAEAHTQDIFRVNSLSGFPSGLVVGHKKEVVAGGGTRTRIYGGWSGSGIIQGDSTIHGSFYVDYSQGMRSCKIVEGDATESATESVKIKGDPKEITGKLLIGKGIPLSTFLGTPGQKTTLNHVADLDKRLEIARNCFMQTEVINLVKRDTSKRFKNFRIIVAEGVYKKGPSEKLKPGSIKDLAQTGRAITYELYDENNKSYPEVTFDFAEYCSEYLGVFDKIILHGDTLDPKGTLHTQVTVIMPEVGPTYEYIQDPSFALETRFNNKVLSSTDIVEIVEKIENDTIIPGTNIV